VCVCLCVCEQLLYLSALQNNYCISLPYRTVTVSLCLTEKLLYLSALQNNYCFSLPYKNITVSLCLTACASVCVCVRAREFGVPERNHVSHLKCLVCVTFLLSAQCSIFLAQMHRTPVFPNTQMHSTFGFPNTQILAKVTILFYSVKTMNSTTSGEQLRWTEMVYIIKYCNCTSTAITTNITILSAVSQ